jgi:hypothetical protein
MKHPTYIYILKKLEVVTQLKHQLRLKNCISTSSSPCLGDDQNGWCENCVSNRIPKKRSNIPRNVVNHFSIILIYLGGLL